MNGVFTGAAMAAFPPLGGKSAHEFLASRHDCQALLHAYAITQDSGDASGFARLFTADAVWKRPGREPLRGRPAILDHARAIFADHGRRTKIAHFITNFDFRLDGAQAFSRSYSFFHRRDGEGDAPAIFGSVIYLNTYRFEEAWRIQEHEARYLVS